MRFVFIRDKMDSDMDKKKTPDTDDLDDNTSESESEDKVDVVNLEEEGGIDETIETAPLTFVQKEQTQAPTVISKDTPVKPESESKMWVAARCNLGAIRDRNEDSCLVYTSEAGGHFTMMPFGLYIVADGMGGHANGHVASKTASRMMARDVINKIYMPLLAGKPNPTPIQEVMADAVRMANTAIYELDESDSGTTLSTALILGRRLHVSHVGDSRIYLMTDGELEAVTKDHSLVNRMQEVGQLTAEEATIFQYRHVLLRALGQTEEVDSDTFMRLLPRNGKLLLCSDGLCGLVPDDAIAAIMQQEIPVDETADQLLQAALDAGGYDNITAIVVAFEF